MSEFDLISSERPATTSVFFIILTALAGFIVIGPLLGFLLALPFIQGSIPDFAESITPTHLTTHPEVKIPLYIIQGSATFFGLAVCPLVYWLVVEKKSLLDFVKQKSIPVGALVLTVLGVLLFMIPNSLFIDWNAHIVFPDFLKGFETWARDREAYAEEVTKYLTTFGSVGEFILAFVVVAVLPGIGEELVFRGMLQPQLQRATRNVHAAIWISAILFSLLHMQFFGFVPRVFLGALFGYLYFWSGNLLVPMVAHFINNGFSLILLYLHQLGKIDIDVESTEAVPWPMLIMGTILTFGLLVYLKKLFKQTSSPS